MKSRLGIFTREEIDGELRQGASSSWSLRLWNTGTAWIGQYERGGKGRVIFGAMGLTRDSVVAATPHHVSADMGEEVILLHLENGLYFGLGNVGTRIWKLLQEPIKVREIEAVLLKEYDVEPERCQGEVMNLVTDLLGQGLVEVHA